jgi:hypothetical protein
MSHVPKHLEPEATHQPPKKAPSKPRRLPERMPDLALRQVVIKAKREGTLGRGSRWQHLDPADEKAW